jgi:hypothetical protein
MTGFFAQLRGFMPAMVLEVDLDVAGEVTVALAFNRDADADVCHSVTLTWCGRFGTVPFLRPGG